VELVRGVPLISVLFMASFLPGRDGAGRPAVGATRPAGGRRKRGPGLWWATQRLVVLPQALGAVVPGLMNSFISIVCAAMSRYSLWVEQRHARSQAR
jgi:general L-amino acid transport system permease protein